MPKSKGGTVPRCPPRSAAYARKYQLPTVSSCLCPNVFYELDDWAFPIARYAIILLNALKLFLYKSLELRSK